MRNTLLVIHIVAVAAWLGANFVQATLTRRMTAPGGEVAISWHRGLVTMGTRYYPIAGAVVLLSGIGLVLDGDVYAFEDPFVVAGVAMVIIGGALGGLVFTPASRRASDLYETGAKQEAQHVEARAMRFGILDTVLLLGTVILMVTRAGA